MWKNIAEPGRPQMTTWRMRFACWIPKATNTHWEYLILIAFPLQQSLYERASMLHYMYTLPALFNLILHHTHLCNLFPVTNGRTALDNSWIIISIVKPTRCTNVSNLFYFVMTLYMFRTVFPSIISSSRLYMQYLFDSCMYSLEPLMMDGKTVRNM